MAQRRWSVVVPVKPLATAKSRLAVAAADRAELALAMALDTVAEALRCPEVAAVFAVTDDERAARSLAALGAEVVADEPAAGLNPALRFGASVAARRLPDSGVAAVSGDLPALDASDLAAVLRATARANRAVVADAAGTGTTLLAAAAGIRLDPAFGLGSLARHLATGAVDLTPVAGPGLRRDVDTVYDLLEARRIGLGLRTARVAERLLAATA